MRGEEKSMPESRDRPDIRRPQDADAAWLTRVLAAGGVDAEVARFTSKAVGTGQIGDSVRFTLEYARGGDGAPRSLVGKFPAAGEQSRATGITLGNYAREVNFYRHLARSAGINTPRCYFADINDTTHEFVLMMEDLAPAAQGDQLKGVTLDEARAVLGEAAKMHASHWGDESLDDMPWVQGSRHAPSPLSTDMVVGVWGAFCDRYGARVSPVARKIGQGIAAAFGQEQARPGPRCLTHNDFRPDNMMFATPAGGYPVTTLDWQTAGYGFGGTDVGYFLSGAIPVETRRKEGAALRQYYLDRLQALGVRYDAEQFARDYAGGAAQLFLTAFFAAMVVTQTARGDDMFFVMLDGAAAEIEDSGAF
jgi:hypothetical protein